MPRPCKLTFDLESGVRVTCDVGHLCTDFSLPRPLCSRLWPDVRDRQTDVRRASSLNACTLGAGHNNNTVHKAPSDVHKVTKGHCSMHFAFTVTLLWMKLMCWKSGGAAGSRTGVLYGDNGRQETQISLTNCATHLSICIGVADLIKHSSPRTTPNSVRLRIGILREPPKLSSAETPPFWDAGRG